MFYLYLMDIPREGSFPGAYKLPLLEVEQLPELFVLL